MTPLKYIVFTNLILLYPRYLWYISGDVCSQCITHWNVLRMFSAFLAYVWVLSHLSHVWLFVTLWIMNPHPHSLRLLVHGDSPDKNTGVGCYVFLQSFFFTQGSNRPLFSCTGCSGLLHWDALGGGLFTTSTTWEALFLAYWDAV